MTPSEANSVAPPAGSVEGLVRGNVGVVTLSRPGKHNAMTRLMWTELPRVINALSAEPDVVSIVIRGADRSFSAGADLTEVLAATENLEAATAYCATVVDALLSLATCPKPTIAALRGVAAGGGAELALAADLRFAEESASLQLPLARIGVVPDDFTLRRLLALGGPAVARLVLFGGRALTAERCLQMGLVDAVSPDGGLDDDIDVHVRAFSAASPYAVREIKALLIADEIGTDTEQLVSGMARSFVSGDVAKSARQFVAKGA